MDQQTLEMNRSMQEHELTSNENLQLQLTSLKLVANRDLQLSGGVVTLQYLLLRGLQQQKTC